MMKLHVVLATTVAALAASPAMAQPMVPSAPGSQGLASSSTSGMSGDNIRLGSLGQSSDLRSLEDDEEPRAELADGNGNSAGDAEEIASSDGGAMTLPGLEAPSGDRGQASGPSPEDLVTVEQEDDAVIMGVMADGRDGVVREDFVPLLTADAILSPAGLHATVYGEESDDWFRMETLASQERSFVDTEGRGDERIDTETQRDLMGLPN